jgi:parallel beta-helix repeat protein
MVYTGGIGMQKNILLSIFFSFIVISKLCSIGIAPPVIQPVTANPATIYVPDTYDTIQKAVDAANPYDTIIVRTGIYRENIFINKTLTLVGENRNTTKIDGGSLGNVIHIRASNVAIINFTIQNSGYDPFIKEYSGIFLFRAVHTTIRDNILKDNDVGVHLRQGSNNTLLIDNVIMNNKASGIRLADNNNFNYVVGNTLNNNSIGVEVHTSSFNTFYHNNFILNKAYQARILGGVSNKWDDSVEGNYWSDYDGLDTDGDGIGDTELPWWVDSYPLIKPWSITKIPFIEIAEDQPIIIQSNCTITSFNFNNSLRQISFRIVGPSVLDFFCNVSVPKTRLNATSSENWLVQLNSTDISGKSIKMENSHTSIHFTGSLNVYDVRIRIVKAGDENFILCAIGFGVAVAVISITAVMIMKKKRRS